MSISDRIKEQPIAPAPGLPCSIGALLGTIKPSEVAALNTMLYELKWNAGQVYDALRAEGYMVGRSSINRHRGKKCRCYKDAP